MRKANVYCNKILAGVLSESEEKEYVFSYDDAYFNNSELPAISLTLPKNKQEYRSRHLFPFFFSLLSEGSNLLTQSRLLHIDENDHFGILLATAQNDTTGAIIVIPVTA